jgi:hypothetical protein
MRHAEGIVVTGSMRAGAIRRGAGAIVARKRTPADHAVILIRAMPPEDDAMKIRIEYCTV